MKHDKEGRPILTEATQMHQPKDFSEQHRPGSNPQRPGPPDHEHVTIHFQHHLTVEISEATIERFLKVYIAESRHINKRLDQIMTSQAEASTRLLALAAAMATVSAGVDKVGVETTKNTQTIADLRAALEAQAGGTLTPEVEAALKSAEDQAVVLAQKVQAVDDQVPDDLPAPA